MTAEAIELPPELAELELVAMAADAQLDVASLPPGTEPPVVPDRGAEFAAMLTMGVAIAAPALPFLPSCYTPETCQQIGTAFAAVAEKHGWNLDLASSPELALALVGIPPTIHAIVLGRQHFAAQRAAAIAHAPRNAPAPAPRQDFAPPPGVPNSHGGERLMPQA